ncbi:hypothetical protein TrVE_jg7519 [Triparma verrucosa]|uniref:WW domain-containing protein n=2 Tax=Triparma TaxID=722752 RepID=A0A9W7AVV4_9STRA|nr:hypothetical protein TrST_g7984 [Triparma strigata]GMI12356.1 hypothetical protein TrVE_jg7519 [Triparma verrucosa]
MPRFFDDYGNCFLTHDSAAGRKQQRRGWKFRENFKAYYERHIPEWRGSQAGLAAAQQQYVKSNPSAELPPLPEGWTEMEDPATGMPLYENEEGDRTWARPGFVPPGPGGGGGGPGGPGMAPRPYAGQIGPNGLRQYGMGMVPSSMRQQQPYGGGGGSYGGGGGAYGGSRPPAPYGGGGAYGAPRGPPPQQYGAPPTPYGAPAPGAYGAPPPANPNNGYGAPPPTNPNNAPPQFAPPPPFAPPPAR